MTSTSSGTSDNIKKEINPLYANLSELEKNIHLDINTGSFFTSVILIVICIVQLFNPATEYIAWIFGLFLLILFPITWFFDIIYNYPNTPNKLYMLVCSSCGIVFEFFAVILTICLNSIIQTRVKEHNDKFGVNASSDKSFKISDQVLTNTKNIKIMFTTVLVLLIGVVSNFFKTVESDNNKNNTGSVMGKNMYYWMSWIPAFLDTIDTNWQYLINWIPMDGFNKMFLLFLFGFCIFLSPFFVKFYISFSQDDLTEEARELIKYYGYDKIGANPKINYDIINFPDIISETAGPVNFRVLACLLLFITFFICMPVFFSIVPSMGFLKLLGFTDTLKHFFTLSTNSTGPGTQIIYGLLLFLLFICPFIPLMISPGSTGKDNIDVDTNNILLFLLCFAFSFLGTPAIFMVFEFFFRIFNNPLSAMLSNLTSNMGKGIFAFIVIIFLTLLLYPFSHGMSTNWMRDYGNNKQIKFFTIVIMSLMVGWFVGLSWHFKMFSFVGKIAFVPIHYVLTIFAPITILALGITQVVLADASAKVPIKVSDG